MRKREEGFAHLYLFALVAVTSILLASSVVPVSRSYNNGKTRVEGVSFAKDGEEDSNSASAKVEAENNKHEAEVKAEAEKKDQEKKVEVRSEISPTKISKEIKDGNLEVKYEVEGDKVKIKTKVKNGEQETELEAEAQDDALEKVKHELEDDDVSVSTASGQTAIINKLSGALTDFPLSVNPTTRELTVTTPSGRKVVAVLPQEAIDNMRAARVIDDVVSDKSEKELGNVQDLVNLNEKDGVLGYEVKGVKNHKVLGLTVKTNVEAFVSAENGQVVTSTESLFGRILTRLGL